MLITPGGSVVPILREVDLLVTPDKVCGDASNYGSRYDTVTMICAGEKGDNKDTCQGDSGGI